MLGRSHGVGGAIVAVMMAVVIVLAAAVVFYSGTQRVTTTVTASPVTTTETTTYTLPPATVTSTLPGTTTTLTVTQASNTTSTFSYSCSTTVTTSSQTTSSAAATGLVDLARNFTSLSLAYGENSSGTSVIIDQSYDLVYASATTYKMTFQVSGSPGSGVTAWVLSNGTVLATESGGQNHTGAYASFLVENSAPVFWQLPAFNSASQITFPVSYIHAIGSSTVTLGSARVTVTNYRANSLPLVYCQGTVPFSLTTVVIQTAPVPGKDFSLITYLDLQGTVSSKPYSFYLSISSITQA
ncbi:MAG: hypothetical protein OK449_06805 [Thaumarchaeota archaeon]|nr:hypothetical protein [Nitrososphaerota archaeon]